MLTECPSCLTVFRVTPAILKMGHGQVRCGKCRKQFDAIECMLEEDEAEQAEAKQESIAPTSGPSSNPADEPSIDFPIYAEEVTLEGSRIEISGTYRVPGAEEADASPGKLVREHVVIDRGELAGSDADDSESSTDADDEEILDLSDDAELDETSDESIANSFDESDVEEEVAQEEEHSVAEAPPAPRRWRRAFAQVGRRKREHAQIHAELDALTQRTMPRVLRTGVWTAICVIFVVALLAQFIHHNRDALVRDSKFGNTVSRLYRAFGLSPTPHWDLAAYKWDVYKLGLDPKIPDALRVVGSVANDAAFAQPYPLGKLSLQDRWGAPVGIRAFEPYEYLPSPESADRLMAPKQRTNIEIVIADPGPDAVGYLIHACLEQDHRLTCADSLPVFK